MVEPCLMAVQERLRMLTNEQVSRQVVGRICDRVSFYSLPRKVFFDRTILPVREFAWHLSGQSVRRLRRRLRSTHV